MKKLTSIFLLTTLCCILAYAAAIDGKVTLVWDYPVSEMTTNLTFKVYSSTNIIIPLTNWVVLTNIVGTTNSVKVQITPGACFFYVTASNFWGESNPSNVASTPVLPRSPQNLKIFKSN